MKRIVIAALCTLLSSLTYAAEGKWTEGFGQGNLEYFIDMQGYRLYIGCPTKDGMPGQKSSVSMSMLSNGKGFNKFAIKAGGNEFDGPFEADSNAGDSNFIGLLQALRKEDAQVSVNGKTIIFPKSNAAKVVPDPKGKKFSCNTSWDD